jgi:hypothetical protein
MIIIAVNVTLHNNIFHSNSYIILICVMCLWPGLMVDTRYIFAASTVLTDCMWDSFMFFEACLPTIHIQQLIFNFNF